MPRLRSRLAALLASLLTLAFFGGLSITAASADDLDDRLAEAKRQQEAATAALDQVNSDLSETDSQLAQAYVDLQAIENQLPVAEATLAQATATLETAQREADSLALRLTDAQAEEAALTTEIETNATAASDARNGVAEMARQAARGDMGMSGLELVIGAQTTDDFINQYNMSTIAMRTQTASLDSLRQTAAVSTNNEVRLAAVKVAISDLKTEADAKVVEADTAKTVAADAKAEVERLIADQAVKKQAIEDRKASEQARQDELEGQSASLTSEIQDIIGLQDVERARIASEKAAAEKAAADKAAATKPGTGGGGATAPAPPSTPVAGKGFFSYPTAVPHITSSYGMRLHPVLNYYRLHAGTDFRAYCGTAIYAAAAGTVQWAKWRDGFGNQVLINHGTVNGSNLMTSYNHLTSFAVSGGASVAKGDLVGYSGNTGLGTACHLHFEVYVNGSTVDPMTML
ncbi:Murein DD-endopeptidase MepM and murein hydrolase activator NlpD, contain LysM domain [Sanguibacter gelidistatuariae]|uniref:Murein DD-endopeptidase MepM and murein hydrolase activator NlpD, contain LysM domain n=1 Tax=Sanguibacter gelidistatuariae TaxID=1814289 RepID=A0A1G6MUE0_9MICO|nr:M23 family metallopeptidase [Sanguibacter gelidistatuariae]SDC59173.1 Murein DD-endopeptidase MepM and murein hydrolase activator NlpD, contain LysM domain [Sanguibacter gelidistatuariae]